MSATVTTMDGRIVPYIKNICKRDHFSGRVVTGGIVTVEDSNWLMSWTFNRTEMDLGFKEKLVLHETLKKIAGTDIEKLLKEYHFI